MSFLCGRMWNAEVSQALRNGVLERGGFVSRRFYLPPEYVHRLFFELKGRHGRVRTTRYRLWRRLRREGLIPLTRLQKCRIVGSYERSDGLADKCMHPFGPMYAVSRELYREL